MIRDTQSCIQIDKQAPTQRAGRQRDDKDDDGHACSSRKICTDRKVLTERLEKGEGRIVNGEGYLANC